MGGGLKLLINRAFSRRAVNIAAVIFFVAMLALVMIFHVDEPASEDYMACKSFGGIFPTILAVLLTAAFLSSEFGGSRFMRSVPFAASMYRKAIPLFSAVYPAALLSATNAVYAAFILITDKNTANISDILIASGIITVILSVALCLTLCASRHVLIVIYVSAFAGCALLSKLLNGFGVNVSAGLLIFVGCVAASFAVNFVIAAASYKKCNLQASAVNNSPYFHE